MYIYIFRYTRFDRNLLHNINYLVDMIIWYTIPDHKILWQSFITFCTYFTYNNIILLIYWTYIVYYLLIILKYIVVISNNN